MTTTRNSLNGFIIDNDHPLSQELVSLRSAAARYQREAYTTSVQLQRYSLEVSNASDRCRLLENQNVILRKELNVLRDHPDIQPHRDTLRVQEMTLALRRLSEKLDATESTLFERNMELAQALSEREKIYQELEQFRIIIEQFRTREQNYAAKERQLELSLESARHERHMADSVIEDYAELVRSLESRLNVESPNEGDGHSNMISPMKSFVEGKQGLQKLLAEHNEARSNFETEIMSLQAELDEARLALEAEQQSSVAVREKLSAAQLQLEKLKIDDSTAAKMVSRYMKFSQSSADVLHSAMANLKLRHESILTGMEAQLFQMESSTASANMRAERLRHALDELTEDISRESFGRRREISLRLAQLSREERIVDGLQQWSARAINTLSTLPDNIAASIRDLCSEASTFLAVLGNGSGHENTGSLARLIVAQDIVSRLTIELQSETEKRVTSERRAIAFVQQEVEERHMPPQSPVTSIGPLHNSDTTQNRSAQLDDLDTEESFRKKMSTAGTQTEDFSPSTVPELWPPMYSGVVIDSCNEVDTVYENQNTLSSPDSESQDEKESEILTVSCGPEVLFDQERNANNSKVAFIETLESVPQDMSMSSSVSEPNEDDEKLQLLSSLSKVKDRYENFQRGFRDCHIALEKLKKQAEFVNVEGSRNLLNVVLGRLNDFNEDARVEVEIRITDEERIATGFETLLLLPKAISEEDEHTLYSKVNSFIDGNDESTLRSRSQLESKLDDIQHDIASVKCAIHENSLPNPLPNHSGWASWTGILPSSRPPSPNPSRSPTFGAVVTSPHLRPHSTVKWLQEDAEPNVFASLKLRIPMPTYYTTSKTTLRSRTSSLMYSLGIGSRDHALSRVPSATGHEARGLESTSFPSEDVE